MGFLPLLPPRARLLLEARAWGTYRFWPLWETQVRAAEVRPVPKAFMARHRRQLSPAVVPSPAPP